MAKADPDDIDDIDPEPVASVIPTLNKLTGIFEYEFGFIPSGQYTAAFTCEANLDDPMTDDVIIFSRGVKNITLANTNKVSVNAFR